MTVAVRSDGCLGAQRSRVAASRKRTKTALQAATGVNIMTMVSGNSHSRHRPCDSNSIRGLLMSRSARAAGVVVGRGSSARCEARVSDAAERFGYGEMEFDVGDGPTGSERGSVFAGGVEHDEAIAQLKTSDFLSIAVVGASGDLAKKKIYPSLFSLYYDGYLPENFVVYGYARSKISDEDFKASIRSTLTCRIDRKKDCEPLMERFLARCYYFAGGYNSPEDFARLSVELQAREGGEKSNRLFYLSIPPNVFVDAAAGAKVASSPSGGWTRVIVEKPFGRDLKSSRELGSGLAKHLTETQIYRIDHYLGKELVENLSVLRFSNLVFQPLWSRQCIRNVQIIFSENFGTEGRGGYFDSFGIIRDIMQNHLLQILALFCMEQPVSLGAEDIRDEKVKVLRSIKPLKMDDLVVGQYKGRITSDGKTLPGYLDDQTVPPNSLTPTFAALALFIDNPRWDQVPFLIKAGKALETRKAEIRVQFRHVPGNLYKHYFGSNIDRATNELVIRLQPDSAIYLTVNNKVPGLGLRLDRSNLDLVYSAKFKEELPDAYERLILDAVKGDKGLFIRDDELDAAWELFTPLLHKLEEQEVCPELYPYGSRGPLGAHYLAAKYGVRWGDFSD